MNSWRSWLRAVAAGLASLVGVAMVLLGLYGLFALSVIGQDWLDCQSGRLGAFVTVARSVPAGYCQSTDFVANFAIAGGLILVGVLGAATIVAVARRSLTAARR